MKKILVLLSILSVLSFSAFAQEDLFENVDGVELSVDQMDEVKGDGWWNKVKKAASTFFRKNPAKKATSTKMNVETGAGFITGNNRQRAKIVVTEGLNLVVNYYFPVTKLPGMDMATNWACARVTDGVFYAGDVTYRAAYKAAGKYNRANQRFTNAYKKGWRPF